MLKKLFGAILAILFACTVAQAQHVEHQAFVLHNLEAGNVGSVVMPVNQYGTVALDVTISAAATVTFQGSTAGGVFTGVTCLASSTALRTTNVLSATVTGMFQCNVAGFQTFRTLISGNTGTVTVFARASTASFQ